MGHLDRFELPQGRAITVVVAEFAGRVDDFGHFRPVAGGAPGTVRGKARVIREQCAETGQKSFAQPVVQLDAIGKKHIAAGL